MSLSLSPSLPLSLSLSLSLSPSLPLSLSLSPSLPLSLSPSLPLSLSLSLSFSVSLSVSLFFSVSLRFTLCLSVFLSVSLFLCLCLSVSHYVSLCVSPCSLSVYLSCLSLCLSVFLCLTIPLCLSLSVSPPSLTICMSLSHFVCTLHHYSPNYVSCSTFSMAAVFEPYVFLNIWCSNGAWAIITTLTSCNSHAFMSPLQSSTFSMLTSIRVIIVVFNL